jgi:CRISPR-associated protein Cas5h
MEKLISIDLKSDFGFFRKPDANNTVNLSYNMLHKPALLGVFGAIVGLDGYKEKGKLPQYYEVFKDLKVGVAPLEHEKGNFQKTVIKYSNTVGYANNGSTYLTEESTLIKPSYRVYTLLDLNNDHQKLLYQYLKEGKAEYLPYFGKNEFSAWWEKESFQDYSFEEVKQLNNDGLIKSLFLKEDVINEQKSSPIFDFMNFWENETPYMYFERLPKGFDDSLFQYKIGDFVLSTFVIKQSANIRNLYYLTDNQSYVQLL